ncbi:prolyl 4-hydroxylase subunit alpha-2-like isoform X2 [Cherax quadricarinatus]|uniref:prolyl 4-hydroxylase subunit alpha-2-like isoform X2 n=1 Tax=Cherax quadricarinatus TaxID=27406 RepID=UPI00387EE5FB
MLTPASGRISIVLTCVWAVCVGVAEGAPRPGNMYTSLEQMNHLFVFDKLVGELLILLPQSIPEASRYLESYWSVSADREKVKGEVTSVEITGNPLHVYSVIKRLVLYWPVLSNLVNISHTLDVVCEDKNVGCKEWSLRGECLHNWQYMILNCQHSCDICLTPEILARVREVVEASNRTVLPTYDDLRGAAFALARLQRTYRIPIGSFMHGRLENTPCSVRLTVEDCVRVANATRHFCYISDAWLWYSYCRATAVDDPLLQAHIQALMDDTALQTDGSLRCHVSNRGAHYLTLQPVRYEHVYNQPDIFLFYDVISDKEIRIIQEQASSLLVRSTVVNKNPYTEARVSQTAWLKNGSHPALLNVARRIAYVTGLFVFEGPIQERAGEELQVLNYGIGGHYDEHMDVFYKGLQEGSWNQSLVYEKEFPAGDRIATWIFYLTDVKSGGRTAFVNAGISVPAVKGAAAFWYNLKKNGNADFRTQHGGCPVLLGNKWVANKWIREHKNFLRRPCSTNPEE